MKRQSRARLLDTPRGAFWVAVWLLFAPLASPLSAQTGLLVVRVTGPTGPVPGATVELLLAGEVLKTGGTNSSGDAALGGLPAGSFDVRVTALGFETEVVTGVRVDPGASRGLEVVLKLAPIPLEGLTVRAERIQIQRENTEFRTTVEEKAILLLPVSYDARDLVALTPGARPEHIWGGASVQANSYRLDGLSTNHPGLGGNLLEPNINWIERIDVRGLGTGAEFGGFQGGLVDVVTKTGTDDFQGFVRAGLESDALNTSNLVKTEIGTEVVGRYDLEGEVRGPLVRDELFYYLSAKRIGQELRALNHLRQVENRYAPIFEERGEEKLFGKLTWTPGPTHLLEASGAFTDTHAENFGLTGYEAAGATHRYSAPVWLFNGSVRELVGDWAILEARLNHFSKDERHDPYGGRELPGISNFSLTPPFNAYQNAPFTLRTAPASTSASVIGSFRIRTGGLEHSLKLGWEQTWGSFLDRRIRNGGVTWLPVNWSGFDPAIPSTWTHLGGTERIASHWGGEVHLDADVGNTALFAQSAIALGSRIVLSPGARWGRWTGWITPTSGERFQAVQDQALDVRVGLSVDLTRDGSLVAKGHWGRYHQNMISQMFDRVAGSDVFTNEEFWYYQGPPFSDPAQTFTEAERNLGAMSYLFTKEGEVILNETGPVRDYKQPFVDQWLVGLEKEISNWGKVEALYVRRSNKDMVALVDLNRASNYTVYQDVRVFETGEWEGAYPARGPTVPFGGGSVVFQELYVPNYLILERLRCLSRGNCPGQPMPPGMTFADTLGLTWDPRFVLTTAPDGRREFSQIQVNLEIARPTWGGSLSFVATDLKGNLDNVSGYTDPAGYGAGPYVHVNEKVNSYGTLENFADREWKASVWGVLPWQLRGGAFWTFQSGDHYSPRFRLYGMGFFQYYVGTGPLGPDGNPLFQGETVDFKFLAPLEGDYVFVGPRGGPTLLPRNILDLRLERMFRFRGRELSVSLDAFNVLRAENITKLNTIVNNGPDYGFRKTYSLFVPEIEPNQYFQAPQERVRPQSFRLGFTAYF